MRRKYKITISLLLLLTLAFSQFAFAVPGKSNGVGPDKEIVYGYEKNIKNFTVIDGNRIKVNKNTVEFDVPPVIKEGRTLIPIRAITEAMGGFVEWIPFDPDNPNDPDTEVAIITSPDKSIIIKFYLKEEANGKIEVIEGGVTTTISSMDVYAGLINNRTFVPLRFIAETFGLKVGYDPGNGQITIDEEPVLTPKKVTYDAPEDIPSTLEVDVTLNGFEFMGIDGLTQGVQFTTASALTIVFYDTYLEGLTEEETTLFFNFKKDALEVQKEFEIKLKYLDEDLKPVLDPKKVEYDDEGDIPSAIPINVTLNNYDFVGITGLVSGTDYDYSSTTGSAIIVLIYDDFVKDLDNEETELYFQFEKGLVSAQEEFEIKLNYIDAELEPDIFPRDVVYSDDDIEIDLDLYGYTLVAITNDGSPLILNTDYTILGDLVTILDSYLDDYAVDQRLHFEFEKSGDFETSKLDIEY